jgi:transposase-like protein
MNNLTIAENKKSNTRGASTIYIQCRYIHLATIKASKKWTMTKQGWAEMIDQLSILFDDRVRLKI